MNAIVELKPAALITQGTNRMAVAEMIAHVSTVQEVMRAVMKKDVHYGMIPGTDKPTLLKPGSEKIADCLNLCPHYEELEKVEDHGLSGLQAFFHYRYRCALKERGTEVLVATGIGSCNSREGRYRWRWSERTCPACKKQTIIKGQAKFGGGWICWKKKGGCGSKFPGGAQEIESQEVGRIENEDIATLVNTIDKMAQKRALVAACLNLGFSDYFTQDVEDWGPQEAQEPDNAPELPGEPAKNAPPATHAPKPADDLNTRRGAIMGALIGKGKPFGTKALEAKEWVQKVAGADITALTAPQCNMVEDAIVKNLAVREPGADG